MPIIGFIPPGGGPLGLGDAPDPGAEPGATAGLGSLGAALSFLPERIAANRSLLMFPAGGAGGLDGAAPYI